MTYFSFLLPATLYYTRDFTFTSFFPEINTTKVLGKDYVQYADPTDNVGYNNCHLYVAALFPNGSVTTKKLLFDQPRGGNEGHALGIVNDYKGEPYTYYFGSAWSRFDVRTQAEWQQRIDWTLRSIREPLTVELK